MASQLRGNRLTIPNKQNPQARENFEAIERWANTQVVNQIIAGEGVTIETQAISTGAGSQGTGLVTINSSGGGVGDSFIQAPAYAPDVSSDLTSPWTITWDTGHVKYNGSDIVIDPGDHTQLDVMTTGIYAIDLILAISLSAGASPQSGVVEFNIDATGTPNPLSDLDNYNHFQGVQRYYCPATHSQPDVPLYFGSNVMYLVAGDTFNMSTEADFNDGGTIEGSTATAFFIRRIG